jgi:hypothetical protein
VDELRVRLRRKMMKKLALGLVAAGALFTATAVPAMAQIGVYTGPGGIGVGAPGPYYYGRPYYPYDGYYNYAPGWGYGLRDGGDATSTAITAKVCS